jgi:hypothetical protein
MMAAQSTEAAMLKLAAMLYVIVAPVAMGVLFTIALMIEPLSGGRGLTVAALLGAALGIPASVAAARQILARVGPR